VTGVKNLISGLLQMRLHLKQNVTEPETGNTTT